MKKSIKQLKDMYIDTIIGYYEDIITDEEDSIGNYLMLSRSIMALTAIDEENFKIIEMIIPRESLKVIHNKIAEYNETLSFYPFYQEYNSF